MQDNDRFDIETGLTLCDREPIHCPGSIQPHGLLIVADPLTLAVVAVAGDVEARLAEKWQACALGDLLGQPVEELTKRLAAGPVTLAPIDGITERFQVVARLGEDHILVEIEPTDARAQTAGEALAWVEAAGSDLERTHDLVDLCETAVRMFRDLTGYDRVMIYRFQEDAAGVVLAESLDPGLGSFLNHHFPATDIPRQARALYVRNRVRVIPDITYVPAPIRAADAATAEALGEIDLSDCALRSVSPIHIQYLKNMDVGASASVSIVKDGVLWGLVACHHREPKPIPLGTRMACRILAGGLSRQIQAKDDAELYRERIRLRAAEDTALSLYDPDIGFERFVASAGNELQRMLGADGFAVLSGNELFSLGRCPRAEDLRAIGRWVVPRAVAAPIQTDRLSQQMPEAKAFADLASGLTAIVLSSEGPTCVLWLRAEKLEVVEWAGNPHKDSSGDPRAVLTPRASFQSWTDTVRGRSRPWSIAEGESAARVGRLLRERRQTARLRDLNRELTETLQENQLLLKQKGFLLQEVNHRVQNSLQLVSAFLKLQSRDIEDPVTRGHLTEAQRRLTAVALVHRRLYTGESVEIVDLGRYLEDLTGELLSSMDPRWSERVRLDLGPVQIKADRAVHVGLVMTELMINAQKYAYGGDVGPLAITLDQNQGRFRLVVADRGVGKTLGPAAVPVPASAAGENRGRGFGSKMMAAMIAQIDGEIDEEDNRPGLRTTVTASVD